jgi:hypothetical protein
MAKKLKKISPQHLGQIEKGLPPSWYNLSSNYELSEEFIRKYKEKVYWYYIFTRQKLSVSFIIEFQYEAKVHLDYICICQKLSAKFIKEFSHKINFNYLPLCFFKIENQNSWKTFL